MILRTEEEARTKWCPLSRVRCHNMANDVAVNRRPGGAPFEGSECIASACMAWEWYDVEKTPRRGFCEALQVRP